MAPPDGSSSIDVPAIDWSSVLNAGPATTGSSSSNLLLGISMTGSGPNPPAEGDGSLQGVANSPQVTEATNDGLTNGYAGVFAQSGQQLGQAAGVIQQAYGAGQAVANQGNSDQLMAARAAAAAVIAKGQILSNTEAAQAKQDAYRANEDAAIGATGPQSDKLDQNIKDNSASLMELLGQKKELDKVSFFSDPISYLYNNIVKVPNLTQQIQDTRDQLSGDVAILSSQSAKMNVSSQASTAIDSVHSIENAALINKQYQAQAIADTSDPLYKAAQLRIGALNMQISAAGEAVKEADSAARLPLIQEETEAYPEYKAAQTANKELINKQLENILKDAPLKTLQRQLDIQELTEKLKDATLTPKIRQLTIDKLTLLKSTADEKTNVVNTGLTALGYGGVKSYTELAPVKADLFSKVGLSLSMNGDYGGGNPLANVKLLESLGVPPSQLPGSYSQTMNDIRSTEADMRAELARGSEKQPAIRGKDADAYINAHIGDVYEKRYELIHDDPANQDHMFSPEPLSSMIDNPLFKSNPVVQGMEKYVTDQAGRRVENVPFMYKTAMETAVDLVHDGKLTKDQAIKAIQEIGQKSLDDKNTAYGFKAFGISANFSKQIIDLARPGSNPLKAHTTVDLQRPDSVAQYLREAELQKYGTLADAAGLAIKSFLDPYGVYTGKVKGADKFQDDPKLRPEAFKPKATQQ